MHIFFLIGLVVCAVLAVLLPDLLKSALALMAASVFLAMLFFEAGAVYAGVFEISVVAGLITVLFIATISLINTDGGEHKERRWARWLFPVFFAALLAADALVMSGLSGQLAALPGAAETGSFGDVFWGRRTFDLVGQIGVILAGVLCVLALFRKRSGDDE